MKHPEQRGPQTPRFERRYGSDGLGNPRGVNTERSGSQIDPDQFTLLINAEWYGNEVRPRASTDVCNSSAIHDPFALVHPYDFRPGSPFRLWYYGQGCPGEHASLGHFIGHYSPDQFPYLQRQAWYGSEPNGVVTAMYGGALHVAVGSQLRALNMFRLPYGEEPISVSGNSSDVPLVDLPAGSHVNAMVEFDGFLFLAVDLGGAAGRIYTWDGRTLREDITGIAVPHSLGLWRDNLVAGFPAAANHIRIRARGVSPGTWTTVAPGAGTIETKEGLNSIVSHKDAVYLVTGTQGSGDVWKYDGTTLAIDHSPASSTRVDSIAEAFGLLYVGYTATDAKLARLSAGVWTDSHKTFTGFAEASAMNFYRSRLGVAIIHASQSTLALSPGDDTAGTYEMLPQAGLFSNRLQSLVPM